MIAVWCCISGLALCLIHQQFMIEQLREHNKRQDDIIERLTTQVLKDKVRELIIPKKNHV